MLYRISKLIKGCVLAISMLAGPAYAGAPVVLEYYGQNGCDQDYDMQRRLYEIVRKRDDVIFLNCRVQYTADVDIDLSATEQEQKRAELSRQNIEEYGAPLFFNDFCSKRSEEHGQNIQQLVHLAVSSVVNGRWIASHYDVMPAVKLGTTDKLGEIGLVREGEALHVSIPADMAASKEGKGTLMLFAYSPSTGVDVGEVIDISLQGNLREFDLDSALSDHERLIPLKKEDDQEHKEHAAASGGEVETAGDFEKNLAAQIKLEKEMNTFFFRPVAAMEKVGDWDGTRSKYNVSLSTIAQETGINVGKMGYVVLLQEGGGSAAPILAAGEIVPESEQMLK